MVATDALMRRQAKFHYDKKKALKDAEKRKGVVIQSIRGSQWVAVSGEVSIKESLKRLKESSAYLGKAPPKIIADYRR